MVLKSGKKAISKYLPVFMQTGWNITPGFYQHKEIHRQGRHIFDMVIMPGDERAFFLRAFKDSRRQAAASSPGYHDEQAGASCIFVSTCAPSILSS
jgi:hypothetical protein